MIDPNKQKFKRAVSQAAGIYGKYLPREEIDQCADDLEETVKDDWLIAILALKSIIQKQDIHPSTGCIFTEYLNIMDDKEDPIWLLFGEDEDEFFRIERPARNQSRKTMPGGDR